MIPPVSHHPKFICQLCAKEILCEELAMMADAPNEREWLFHDIQRKGGVVRILTCPDCSESTEEKIFETYVKRIREGLIPCFH